MCKFNAHSDISYRILFHHLSQSGNECWDMRISQLEQLVMESHGDEAFQGRPEVMGIRAEPLNQPPTQTHSLHTERIIME